MTPPPRKNELPRLVPDEPFPAYAFVPGRSPHPFADPAGHSYGSVPRRPPAPDPERWHSSRAYLHGVDLFNFGYYWEAHEAWEGLWQACGRAGVTADFLKALIKLAAAGVKTREGRSAGVRSHARRAADLFRNVAAQPGSGSSSYMGLSLPALADFAESLAARPECREARDDTTGAGVLDIVLRPELADSGTRQPPA